MFCDLSKLLYFSLVVATTTACSQVFSPGTVTTTTISTTTTTTTNSDDAKEDSGLEVSAHDRQLIRSTWNIAKKDGDVAPAILFRFLKAHPEYQAKFSRFAKIPQSELMKNGNFLAQAYTIMAGLNVVIQSSSSQELLANQLSNLGTTHFERGVTVVMFEQFARSIINVLEDEIKISSEAKNAWENGLTAMVAGISKSLKDAENVPNPLTHLTPHMIEDVRRGWETVRNDRNSIISTVFLKLFQENPNTQKKFTVFADVSPEDLPSNAAFNLQVALVADRLDNMIATMDNTLQILGQIQYMAHSHKPRNVGRQLFEDFSRILKDVLGSKGISADDLGCPWKNTLNILVDGIANVQGI